MTAHEQASWAAALQLFRWHLVVESGRRQSTFQTHVAYLHRLEADGHRDPYQVTAGHLLAWLASHPEWAPDSRLSARAALRSFYGWAHRTGRTLDNPALTAFPPSTGNARVARGQDLPRQWAPLVGSYAEYLAAAGRRPQTIRQHRMHLGMFARTHTEPLGVTESAILAYLGSRDWAPETRKSARSVLRTFYAWAVRAGHTANSPALYLPAVRVPGGTPHPVPTAVLDAALSAADDKTRLMVLLAAYAGLRRAEIAAVHPARDISDGVLHVTGKGGRRRLVPLHPVLVEAITNELDRRRAGQVGSGFRYRNAATADGYLFPGQLPGSCTTPDAIGASVSPLLGEHYSAHGLRHRFATRAYAGTRDIRAVQELLGHSKPETTARYTAVPDGALKDAVMAV